MSRPPSTETQLRTANSELKRLRLQCQRSNAEASLWERRAATLEKELEQWKERFDLLLSRTPKAQP